MGTAVADLRDELTWVVLELTRQGENRAEEGTLCVGLRDCLGVGADHRVFVPSATYRKSGHRVTIHLMEGYAFIASGLPDNRYFGLERDSALVRQVLSTVGSGGMKVLHVLPDSEIQSMNARLSEIVSHDIEEGMRVHINRGTYNRLDGLVVHLDGKDAFVLVELRSYKVIRPIPRVFLEPVDEGEDHNL
jgi:hypothetical protein